MVTGDFVGAWDTHLKISRGQHCRAYEKEKTAENGNCCASSCRLPGLSLVTRCGSGVRKRESILGLSGVKCLVLSRVSLGSCSNFESCLVSFLYWPLGSAGRQTWVPTSTSRSCGGKSSRMWCDSSSVFAVGSIDSCLPCTELPGQPDQTKLAGWDIRPSKVTRQGGVHVLHDGVANFYVSFHP